MFERFMMFQQTTYCYRILQKILENFHRSEKLNSMKINTGEKSESENDEERVHFCIVS